MKSIRYRQLGHLDSVYPLISTSVPHLSHLYNYKPPTILLMFLVAVLHGGVWQVCSASEDCSTFAAFPYACSSPFNSRTVTFRTDVIFFSCFLRWTSRFSLLSYRTGHRIFRLYLLFLVLAIIITYLFILNFF